MPLLCEVIMESSVQDGESRIPHDQVVKGLDRDLVGRSCRIGTGGGYRFSGGPFSQYAVLSLEVSFSCPP